MHMCLYRALLIGGHVCIAAHFPTTTHISLLAMGREVTWKSRCLIPASTELYHSNKHHQIPQQMSGCENKCKVPLTYSVSVLLNDCHCNNEDTGIRFSAISFFHSSKFIQYTWIKHFYKYLHTKYMQHFFWTPPGTEHTIHGIIIFCDNSTSPYRSSYCFFPLNFGWLMHTFAFHWHQQSHFITASPVLILSYLNMQRTATDHF